MTENRSTKTRILQSALSLFAAKGFDGVSLRAIAAHADIANQLLVYHFKDKESLWLGTVEWASQQAALRKTQLTASYRQDTPREAFRQHIFITLQQFYTHPELPKLLFWEAAQNSVRYQQVFTALIQPQFDELIKIITLMQQQKVVRCDISTQHIASILQAAITQRVFTDYELQQLTGESLKDKKSLADFSDSLFKLLT